LAFVLHPPMVNQVISLVYTLNNFITEMEDKTIYLVAAFAIGVPVLLMLLKALYDWRAGNNEDKEVKKEMDATLLKFGAAGKKLLAVREQKQSEQEARDHDTISQMADNASELRGYYVISKRQARQAFSAALMACILGFMIYMVGIIIYYTQSVNGETNVLSYAAVGGSIVEVISGLFFWLYSKANEQMNHYHESLIETQRQLTAIQLSEKMDTANRDKAFNYIITKLMDQSQQASIDASSGTADAAAS
jgi:Na+/melibiose symporter-like transporter